MQLVIQKRTITIRLVNDDPRAVRSDHAQAQAGHSDATDRPPAGHYATRQLDTRASANRLDSYIRIYIYIKL